MFSPAASIRQTSKNRTSRAPSELPLAAWTLALIDGASAIVLAAVAAKPLAPTAPVHLAVACAALLAACAVLTFVLAECLTPAALLGIALLRVAVVVALAASAATGGGTILAFAGCVWVAIWAAAFFSQRELRLVLSCEIAGALVAVLLNSDQLRTLADALPIMFASVVMSALLLTIISALRQQARYDQLTYVHNRHGLEQALTELQSRRRRREPLSLVAFDLDGLKAVNDLGGHAAGDRMLIEFATELTEATRGRDICARVGGDEFVVLLPGLSGAGAADWTERLRLDSHLSWSCGIAERRTDEPLEAWFARADSCMYAAKAVRRAQPLTV